MNSSSAPVTEINWRFVRQISWHFLVAAILGPFLVSLLYVAREPWVESLPVALFSTLGMMLFGVPIISFFVAVTLLPFFRLTRIRGSRNRERAFVLVGGVLGLLVGIWFVYSDIAKASSWVFVAETILVGLLCGYLDSLAWEESNEESVPP